MISTLSKKQADALGELIRKWKALNDASRDLDECGGSGGRYQTVGERKRELDKAVEDAAKAFENAK